MKKKLTKVLAVTLVLTLILASAVYRCRCGEAGDSGPV